MVSLHFQDLMQQGYTVQFNFVVIDKMFQTYAFRVRDTTLVEWLDRLNKVFAVPYDTTLDPVIQAEEVELEEAVDAIGQLQKIKDTHQHGTVNHKDNSASKVDAQTAHAILTVHKSLNDVNKKKFADMVSRSSGHLQKAADFSWKHMK
jgi:hypothetical protein